MLELGGLHGVKGLASLGSPLGALPTPGQVKHPVFGGRGRAPHIAQVTLDSGHFLRAPIWPTLTQVFACHFTAALDESSTPAR